MSAKMLILGLRPVPAAIVVLAGVAVVVAGVAYGFSEVLKADKRLGEIVWGPDICPVVGWDPYANLIVECDSKQYNVPYESIKLSYAYNPGPLNCSVTRGGYVGCDLRPFKPAPAE